MARNRGTTCGGTRGRHQAEYTPKIIRTDGKEFCSLGHTERGLTLRLIEPGKPNQNAYIESFNGRFRDECLNPKHTYPNTVQRTESAKISARTRVKKGCQSTPGVSRALSTAYNCT
jgi:transposase InsO family protein